MIQRTKPLRHAYAAHPTDYGLQRFLRLSGQIAHKAGKLLSIPLFPRMLTRLRSGPLKPHANIVHEAPPGGHLRNGIFCSILYLRI